MPTSGENPTPAVAQQRPLTWSYGSALAALYGLLGLLLVFTWRRWPDVLVDFGRELYVPWRLAEGAVLYRDVAYFNGPFSPYFNAVLFRTFGASMTTIVVTNTLLLGVLLTVMFTLATKVFRLTTAFAACACFLPLFGFSHMLRIGNYNYICPYSHEMTHGILIAFLILALLFSQARGLWWCNLIIGFLWGCSFLGKAEIFMATSGMVLFTFVLRWKSERLRFQAVVSRASWILLGAAIPTASFILWLSRWMDGWEAFRGVIGTWGWIIGSEVTDEVFYQRMTGMDTPVLSLLVMARATGAMALACLAAGYVERWRQGKQSAALWFVIAAMGGVFFLVGSTFPVILQGRSLLIVAVVLFVVLACLRWRAKAPRSNGLDVMLSWVVLGGLLLAKFALRPTIAHYGFVLAMPLVIMLIAWLLERVPEYLCPTTGGGTCRAVLAVLLLADVMGSLSMTTVNLLRKDVVVSSGDDLLLADANRGADEVAHAVQYLAEQTPPDATVMVLPEGVMLNYLARRVSSTPYVNLCPPEVTMYGDEAIARAMAENPADYIVLVNKDVREYGKKTFGDADYGLKMMQFVRQHYTPIQVFGRPYTESPEHGITILVRSDQQLARQ